MTREELREYVEELESQGEIPYHVYSNLIDCIDTLEQEPIIDKIRVEIDNLKRFEIRGEKTPLINGDKALNIIDKYKAESEDKE